MSAKITLWTILSSGDNGTEFWNAVELWNGAELRTGAGNTAERGVVCEHRAAACEGNHLLAPSSHLCSTIILLHRVQLKGGRIANQVCIPLEKKAEVKKILPCYWCYLFLISFFIIVIQIQILQDNLIAQQLLLSYPSCAVHNYCGFWKNRKVYSFLNII